MSAIYQNNVMVFEQATKELTTINMVIPKNNLLTDISTDNSFSAKVTKLCLSHQVNNKWIMLIDNKEQAMSVVLNQDNIDKSKILCINSHKISVNAANIETALSKGNCSAVVIVDNNFASEQLTHLSNCALKSNTTFIVFDKVSGLH